MSFLLPTDLFAADAGNKNGVGDKPASVGGKIAGDAGSKKSNRLFCVSAFDFLQGIRLFFIRSRIRLLI
ncbi:MAG: hypothetical protein LIP00_11730 [Parabacteroides sp.]|nr:hypothetical protein [Parabacteroides sp.]